MVKCERCEKEMTRAKGCIHQLIAYKDGQTFNPIKYGDEEEDWTGGDKNSRCHDCGCKVGGYHHSGCDVERCPRCEGQLITCDCILEGELNETKD